MVMLAVAAIALLVMYRLTFATELPRMGLWIDGKCCTDCWDKATPETEICVALGEPEHLYPDLDYEAGKPMGSDYNTASPASPVAEPMTIVLVGTGLIVIGRMARRRR